MLKDSATVTKYENDKEYVNFQVTYFVNLCDEDFAKVKNEMKDVPTEIVDKAVNLPYNNFSGKSNMITIDPNNEAHKEIVSCFDEGFYCDNLEPCEPFEYYDLVTLSNFTDLVKELYKFSKANMGDKPNLIDLSTENSEYSLLFYHTIEDNKDKFLLVAHFYENVFIANSEQMNFEILEIKHNLCDFLNNVLFEKYYRLKNL